MKRAKLPQECHCGSGKYPGTMRPAPRGEPSRWCCGVCHNDFKRCDGEQAKTEPREQVNG